jgi:hypothetical protein
VTFGDKDQSSFMSITIASPHDYNDMLSDNINRYTNSGVKIELGAYQWRSDIDLSTPVLPTKRIIPARDVLGQAVATGLQEDGAKALFAGAMVGATLVAQSLF